MERGGRDTRGLTNGDPGKVGGPEAMVQQRGSLLGHGDCGRKMFFRPSGWGFYTPKCQSEIVPSRAAIRAVRVEEVAKREAGGRLGDFRGF